MQNKKETLFNLIAQKADIIPFLKTLDLKDKKALFPEIRKIHANYFGTEKIEGSHYKFNYSYNETIREKVTQAMFVCAPNYRSYVNEIWVCGDPYRLLSTFIIEDIIPWYKPNWYEPLFQKTDCAWWFDYIELMELSKKGILSFPKEVIAATLQKSIIQFVGAHPDGRNEHKIDQLYIYPETLSEHIWWFFELQSEIHSVYSGEIEGLTNQNKNIWAATFEILVNESKLSRIRVLEKSLLCCTAGFNNSLTGWFYRLVKILIPTKEELIELQNALFICINSSSSIAMNNGLNYLKEIFKAEAFDKDRFYNAIPNLLNAPTKSIINSTLTLIDKIGSQNKKDQYKLSQLAITAFGHDDLKIQVKAAKLIKKFTKEDQTLNLSLYADQLYNDSRKLLNPWLDKIEPSRDQDDIEISNFNPIREDNLIPPINTFDDLFFFISQSLENNSPQDLELMIAYLPKLKEVLNKENVGKLAPIFDRALKLIRKGDFSIELLGAYYINDFADGLHAIYPKELEAYYKTTAKYNKKLESSNNRIAPLKALQFPDSIFNCLNDMFIHSQKLLVQNSNLTLISKPSHSPCWISMEAAVDRILEYQITSKDIHILDWQFTIFRIPLKQKVDKNIISKIKKISHSDIQNTLLYLCDEKELNLADFKSSSYILPALISKRDFKHIEKLEKYFKLNLLPLWKELVWKITVDSSTYQGWDRASNSLGTQVLTWYRLNINDHSKGYIIDAGHDILSKFYSIQGIKQKDPYDNSLYYIQSKFMLFIPNASDLFLKHFFPSLSTSDFYEAHDQRKIISAYEFLFEIWRKDDRLSNYLLVAATILCNYKLARTIVAELWIRNIEYDLFNIPLLGELIGKLLHDNYAPLKRLTDLMLSHMNKVSKLHDQALITLIESIIPNMNSTPIKNTKKLLEIYAELILKYPAKANSNLLNQQLEHWKKTKSLLKIIKSIEINH